MKAMIFAAGLGTRLKPITDSIPKALLPIANKPLLEHVILKLKNAGFNQLVVNVHHFPDQIIDFLHANSNFGIDIQIADERLKLLDTGGGIKNIESIFPGNEPFLVHNVDILSNIDLNDLYAEHCKNNPLATLVVSKRDTFRYLLFEQNQLRGWINEKTNETKPEGFQLNGEYQKLAFSGIQILSHNVFNRMNAYPDKFPIMDFYLNTCSSENIVGYIPTDLKLLDVGKLNVLDDAEAFVRTF
jgi:NDP-sugar pyrophosphorylase family protein